MDTEFRRPLIVGNWKMNGTINESIKWVTALSNLLVGDPQVDVVLAPPFTSLYSVSVALSDTNMAMAAQNMFYEDEGPFTGEISGTFLKEVGCTYVILGHSERRQHFGETDKMINLKVQTALRNELTPILCVGEPLPVREEGKALDYIDEQLKNCFTDIAIHDFEKMVIAYEPIWAIGTGKNAQPEQAGEVHQFIRNWLMKYFDAPTANKLKILYGGSVKPDNAASLMKEPQVDGLLVGGASLDPEAFAQIVKFREGIS